MVSDGDLQARVSRRRLSLVNVMWEDTGRSQGSALGPNISDLTLQVRRKRLATYYAELGLDASDVPSGPLRAPFDDALCDVVAEFRPPIV